MEKQILL